MLKEVELISQLLRLGANWNILSVEIDHPSDRIDIMVSQGKRKKGFFGFTLREVEEPNIALQHLPFASMRTYLHVPESNISDAYQTWAVEGSHLTRDMEKFLTEALHSCNSIHAVTKLTQLTSLEIKEFSGRSGVTLQNVPTNTAATQDVSTAPLDPAINRTEHMQHTPTHSFELNESINLPIETDQAWDQLIEGIILISPDSLALQMLLQRVKLKISLSPTEVTRLASIKLLRQYLIKNQHQHKKEIALLNKNVSIASTPKRPETVKTYDLPNIKASCWRNIINGSIKINTDNVGLQMMMERLRLSVGSTAPDAQISIAGSNMLYQFFSKHRKSLKEEITQISGAITTTGITGQSSSTPNTTTAHKSSAITSKPLTPPTVSATIWQDLMARKIMLSTDNVGLQMMIERMRISVENDPSDSTKLSSAKILHRFFIKYQNRLQSEIKQLGVSTVSVDIVNDKKLQSIPPDNHPSWQRLIDGHLVIKTDVVALKMMLQSIRISVGNNPSSQTRVTGAKMLRQYFLKHKNKHQPELEQLMAA